MRLAAAGLYGLPEKDPVCGREVYSSKAKAGGLTLEFEGKTYYFCSEKCKDQFKKPNLFHSQTPTLRSEQHLSRDQKSQTAVGLASDPVCDMSVDQGKSMAAGLTSEHQGKTYYFCTEECKKQFDQEPLRYLEKGSGKKIQQSTPSHAGHQHD